MTETILDSLVVKIRADGSALKDQLGSIEKDFTRLDSVADKTAAGMSRVFENFARSGKLSFDSLRQTALSVLNDIAGSAIRSGINSIFGSGGSSGGFSNFLGSLASSFLGGRAGGGSVSARQPYMVGERGPELFMPEMPGRIIPAGARPAGSGGGGKVTNITVNITNKGNEQDMTQRSAGQLAVAVNRAMKQAERNL